MSFSLASGWSHAPLMFEFSSCVSAFVFRMHAATYSGCGVMSVDCVCVLRAVL